MRDQEIEAAKAASCSEWDAQVALRGALYGDVMAMGSLVDQQPSCQALRRAFVRSCWGYIEGSIHGLAEYLRVLEDSTNNRDPKRPPEKGNTLEQIKERLKWLGRRLTADWQPDCGGPGWAAIRKSLCVRDRLMHPKSAETFVVSQEDQDFTQDGMVWFVQTMIEIEARHDAWCERERTHQRDTLSKN